MAGSRYDLFRRRLAPIALVIAIVVIVHEAWKGKDGADRETVELRFGAHAAEVRRVHAVVFVDDQPAGQLDADVVAGGSAPVRFPVVLDSDRARIMVDVTTTSGPRRVERALARAAGSTVIVDLGPDLDAPAPPPASR